MGPIAKAYGHDPPGLIDEVVPSLAAMVDDVVAGFEDRFESQLSRRNCQTFSCGLSSGHFAGNGIKVMLGGMTSRPTDASRPDRREAPRGRPARSERRFRPGAGSSPPCCIWA